MAARVNNPAEFQGIKVMEISTFLEKEEKMRKNDSLISRLDAFKSVDLGRGLLLTRNKPQAKTAVIGRTPRLSTFDITESKHLTINNTPRLHGRSQLINFGSRNWEDGEFYYNLEETVRRLPQARDSVSTIQVSEFEL